MILLEASGPLRLSSVFHVYLEQKHKHCAAVSMEGESSVLPLSLLVICARSFGLLPSLMMHGTLASHYPKTGRGRWHSLVKAVALFGFRIAWPTEKRENKVCCLSSLFSKIVITILICDCCKLHFNIFHIQAHFCRAWSDR